jgi:tRNA 2-thiouridine synthesizing protein A
VNETLLDLRGMRCPWPAIRVARALREAGEGAVILAVADDPAAPREIGAVADERGWRISQADSNIGPALRLIANSA